MTADNLGRVSGFDSRLGYDGSETDKAAEAILCCQTLATDFNGRVLGCGEPIAVAIQRARAVVNLLPRYGYKIVPCEPTDQPCVTGETWL